MAGARIADRLIPEHIDCVCVKSVSSLTRPDSWWQCDSRQRTVVRIGVKDANLNSYSF